MTFFIAFGLIAVCIVLLSIGKLLTGKHKLHCKRCSKPEDDCPHCGKKK